MTFIKYLAWTGCGILGFGVMSLLYFLTRRIRNNWIRILFFVVKAVASTGLAYLLIAEASPFLWKFDFPLMAIDIGLMADCVVDILMQFSSSARSGKSNKLRYLVLALVMAASLVYGTVNMLETVSRIMRRQESGGSIINITSLTALKGNKGQFVYSATKGAVISLTKSAAKELSEMNIRVNAIAPGLTNTDMMRQADPEKLQGRIDNICMGRLAEPEDIANAVLFLASDASTYISGQVIGVDGGMGC